MKKIADRSLALILMLIIGIMFVASVVTHGKEYYWAAFINYKNRLSDDAGAYENVRARVEELKSAVSSKVFMRDELRRANAAFQQALGKEMLDIGKHTTLKLDCGAYYNMMSGDYTYKKADELIEFAASVDVPVLFAYCHCGLFDNDELPDGALAIDNNNAGADDLLKYLSDAGVDVLDSRASFARTGMSAAEAIFKSDIHWSHRMALETAFDAVKRLNERCGFGISETALAYENFSTETHENAYFGEIGTRLGVGNVPYDDIGILLPKYDTHISYEGTRDAVIEREGTFSEAIVERDKLEIDPEYGASIKAYYVYGNYSTRTHTVNRAAAPLKALIFKDSFGTPLASFLSLAFEETYTVDMRVSDETMNEIVASVKPDVIIIAYSQQTLRDFAFVLND